MSFLDLHPANVLLGSSSTSRAGTEYLVGPSHYSSNRSTRSSIQHLLISAHHDVINSKKYAHHQAWHLSHS
jgi:hypothetical protein